MTDDWRRLSLREANVMLIDCDHRTPPASEEGYPYVAIPQLRDGHIDLSNARRITHELFVEWTRKAKPTTNDVVLSRRCNPGETAFVPPNLEFALGQNLVLLRADGTRVHPPFLRWLVRSPEWWEQIGKFLNVGAVFDSLRCADVPKFELPIPPLEEQRAIARVLGALDDKIQLYLRMSQTLEALARALYKSWFVEFAPVRTKVAGRSPGLPQHLADLFPTRLVDCELGAIPYGWKIRSASEVCDTIFSGGTPSTAEPRYWAGGIPWLSSGETRSKFIVAAEKSITAEGVTNSSTRLAKAGATVIASAGQGHTRGQASMLMFDCYINQSVIALQPDLRYTSSAHLFFDLERRYEEFRQLSDGHSSRGSLTTKLLAGTLMIMPPRTLIEAFDKIAAPMVLRIADALSESRTLASLRDTLLPKLISGELRLRRAQSVVEEAV